MNNCEEGCGLEVDCVSGVCLDKISCMHRGMCIRKEMTAAPTQESTDEKVYQQQISRGGSTSTDKIEVELTPQEVAMLGAPFPKEHTPRDRQVGGDHYKRFAIQPIEFILKNNLSYCQGNVLKYLVRYQHKNGIEDLRKAAHYLEMLIERELNHANES